MSTDSDIPDREFVSQLRTSVDAYLRAVDQWEAAFQRHYRMPDCGRKISADMAAEQREYDERRRDLKLLLPRARRLCLKQDLTDPFSGLLRVSLGQFSPQQRMDSSIGRGERTAAAVCLMELHEACAEWPAAPEPEPAEPSSKPGNRSLLGRVLDYFY